MCVFSFYTGVKDERALRTPSTFWVIELRTGGNVKVVWRNDMSRGRSNDTHGCVGRGVALQDGKGSVILVNEKGGS